MAIGLGEKYLSKGDGENSIGAIRAAEFVLIFQKPSQSKNRKFMMELLPPEIREVLPKFHAQEKLEDPLVYLKFFFPAGNWTWFVTEGEAEGDDFLFYGYVIGLEREWGYFALSELEEINIQFLTVERDLYFKQESFSCALARWKRERGEAACVSD
jgi:hypothetical protein